MQKEKLIKVAKAGGLAAAALGAGYFIVAKLKTAFGGGSHAALLKTVPGAAPLNPVVHSVAHVNALQNAVPRTGTLGSGLPVGSPRVTPTATVPTPHYDSGSGVLQVPETTVYGTPDATDVSALSKSAPSAPSTVKTIQDVQRALNALGYASPLLAVDGVAGPLTKEATRKYQADNPPLVVDGIAGPLTKAALYKSVKAA